MKPNYTSFKKLTDKSKDFKLKVRVVHKGPPAESPSKRRYQKLVFKDEEGTTMKGTLFEKDIETYEQALQRNGEYELSGVNIRPLPAPFRSRPDEEYQIGLGGRMKIKALDLSECSNEPQYRELANVPTTYKYDDPLLDIAAIVIFVADVREEKNAGYTQQIREIILADQSVTRPMKLTAKNHFAFNDAAEFMIKWHENFQIVGFTGIRPTTYKGLGLSTTLSSTYVANPVGDIPTAVGDWMREQMAFLGEWRAKAMMIYSDAPSKIVTTLESISPKKANAIWQDEYYWTAVSLSTLQAQDIYFYYGCDICGKRASGQPGTKFSCYTCSANDATVESRLVMTTNLIDASGTLKVTAYTAETETLINLRADEFCALKKKDNAALKDKLDEVKDKHFLVKICPNHELSTGNVLKWIVSAVESLPITKDDVTNSANETETTGKHVEAADTNVNEKDAGTKADIGITVVAQPDSHEGTSKWIVSAVEPLPITEEVATDSHEGTSNQNTSDEETPDNEVSAGESQRPKSEDAAESNPTV